MTSRFVYHERGFSLVELSVVLVMIGLLLGGLVAGRNYTRNAEMNSLVNESKFYINAFGQFQQQYNAVPGDFANANATWTGHDGDGNGQILSSTAAGATALPEVFYAFEHLRYAKLIDGNFTGLTAGGVGTFTAKIGTNVPRSQFPNAMYLFDHPSALDGNVASDSVYFDGFYGHVLEVFAFTEPTTNLPAYTPVLTPAQGLAIDTKFDDGKPGTGWITTPKYAALNTCTTSNTASSSVYSTSNHAIACSFILKVQ